ncbi:MAG TPA: Holliday junction resolvase RuvX [Thermotogota bacterium]|nr:Holliday junction resolvase RuvX [Thermotogota bacterium]
MYALDFGTKRIGVARSEGEWVFPEEPLQNVPGIEGRLRERWQQSGVHSVVVGLPLNMEGGFSASTDMAVDFATGLYFPDAYTLYFVDERLTTAQSLKLHQALGRSQKKGRATIDSSSAALILEQFVRNPPGAYRYNESFLSIAQLREKIRLLKNPAGHDTISLVVDGGMELPHLEEELPDTVRVFERNPLVFRRLRDQTFGSHVLEYRFLWGTHPGCARGSTG